MDIYIKFMGGSTYLLKGVSLIATVGDLKELIQQKSGIAPARQKLSFAQKMEFNDTSPLSAIRGLADGSSVMVLVQDSAPFQVFLKKLNGMTSTYDVMPRETVSDFKKKVYRKEEVAENQQRLVYNGKQLEDDKTLEDYGIGPSSTIQLTLRLRGG